MAMTLLSRFVSLYLILKREILCFHIYIIFIYYIGNMKTSFPVQHCPLLVRIRHSEDGLLIKFGFNIFHNNL